MRRGEIYDYLHVTVTAQGTLTYGTSLVPRKESDDDGGAWLTPGALSAPILVFRGSA